jgi:hypothetical protein
MKLPRRLLWCIAVLSLGAGAASSGAAGPSASRTAKKSEAGSDEVRHWAFQPVQRPPLPLGRGSVWVRSQIDAFVLARLQKEGLAPSPPTDKRTLLRRVYLDLIGLPPTPEEQQAFLQDGSPDAYARVVDSLLARPEYGERWARHWLDVVRYAESNGYERDGAKPFAWRYRDYIIDAFNKDKPYDRFVTEQLAGDELEDSNAEAQIATTFLRLGTWDDEPADPVVDRYDQLDDVLGTTAATFLALTLRCARCHDHKFEPFTQKEYYSALAVFEPLKRPQNGRTDLTRPVGTRKELAAYHMAVSKVDAEIAAVQRQLDGLMKSIRNRVLATVASSGTGRKDWPTNVSKTSLSPEAVTALKVATGKLTPQQKQLVKKAEAQLEREIRQAATPGEKAQRERLEKQLAALNAARPKDPPMAYIWYEDTSQAPVTHVFRRGDPTRPKGSVGPAVPAVLASRQPAPARPLAKSTGRRLWLARWMTRPDNPLLARVMVNRVWQHHFGEGLVATPNDFGVMGQPPSHPELLDWLAAEFVAGGWRLKALHRTIVLSSTYQMSTFADARMRQADPDNALLGRWRQRRLEAEVVRDSILAVNGRLNQQMAGPSIYPTLPRAVLEGQSRPGEGWGKSDEHQASRRSIYIFAKRSLGVPELELLDTPDSTSSCEKRPISTTGPQALTFLNGSFVNQQAQSLADRLVHEAGSDARAQVQRAFGLVLCRPPSAGELHAALVFLKKQQRQIDTDLRRMNKDPAAADRRALAALCLVLLNTNEFTYVS